VGGPEEARLYTRWALTEGEAEGAGLRERTAVSEWRFGSGDVQVGNAGGSGPMGAFVQKV
jgi:hypothetical protein